MAIAAGLSTFAGCKNMTSEKPLRIALSSGSENYVNWVHRGDSTVEIIDFKGMHADSALVLLATCDAIVFTGGEDVSPGYYGKESDSALCSTNPERDSLEFELIKESMRLKIPVFGVCRGQQILNVAMGGTLITDIPKYHPGNVLHQIEDYLKCFHQVSLEKNSLLQSIARADSAMVTSNHHQAIEKLAPGLRITAWSNDSIPEAIEWGDPSDKPFFIAVQWHPERMDSENPLSMPLMNAFIKAAKINRSREIK
jgi:putative glutamine amidotransferase